MKKDEYVKIVAVNGNYRYGYIESIADRGFLLCISLFDEGESKIGFDTAYDALLGKETIDWVASLTEVEKTVVPLLSNGLNTKEIANKLSISPVTVRAHLRTLRIKLHLGDRTQLVAFSQALNKMIIQKEKDGRTSNKP